MSLIAGFLAVCVALAVLGRAHRGSRAEIHFQRGFAVLIPCFTVPMQVLQLLPSDYDIATSLPVQLCDLAWIAAEPGPSSTSSGPGPGMSWWRSSWCVPCGL